MDHYLEKDLYNKCYIHGCENQRLQHGLCQECYEILTASDPSQTRQLKINIPIGEYMLMKKEMIAKEFSNWTQYFKWRNRRDWRFNDGGSKEYDIDVIKETITKIGENVLETLKYKADDIIKERLKEHMSEIYEIVENIEEYNENVKIEMVSRLSSVEETLKQLKLSK